MRSLPWLLSLAFAPAVTAACYDPVHDDAVEALGPEQSGVPRGPMHRPGQPCTTCHAGNGPGDPAFALAGTLFEVRGQPAPLVGGVVTVTDATGAKREVTANAAGNFFITREEWSPVFPLSVVIAAGGVERPMATKIGRDGGCAACHRGSGDSSLMPGVFLRDL